MLHHNLILCSPAKYAVNYDRLSSSYSINRKPETGNVPGYQSHSICTILYPIWREKFNKYRFIIKHKLKIWGFLFVFLIIEPYFIFYLFLIFFVFILGSFYYWPSLQYCHTIHLFILLEFALLHCVRLGIINTHWLTSLAEENGLTIIIAVEVLHATHSHCFR